MFGLGSQVKPRRTKSAAQTAPVVEDNAADWDPGTQAGLTRKPLLKMERPKRTTLLFTSQLFSVSLFSTLSFFPYLKILSNRKQ